MAFEDEEEDEINIDFSKIKNIFKRKKEPELEEEAPEAKPKETAEGKPKESIEAKPKETNEEKPKETTEEKIVTSKAPNPGEKPEKETEQKVKIAEEEHPDTEDTTQKTDDEEEINFDFGKLKSFFKGRKKESSQTKIAESKEPADEESEEISFDFSKVKLFFKNMFSKSSEPDEEQVDTSQAWSWIKTHKATLIPFLLILIPLLLSIYVRVQPASLPITDQWAESTVYNQVRSQVESQVNQQYPNLPQANKNAIVATEFEKIRKQQQSQLSQQIAATSNFFKSRMQDENGQTYLLAIDPYFWMRHAKNVVENGHPGDELRVRNGEQRPYDTFMFAPVGRFIPRDMFHAFFEGYLFKFLSVFNRNLDLMAVAFYVPVILSALAIIPAFFIGRRLGGNIGGFVGAFIVAIHPALLTRTAGGFADTDAYNALFPLLITWLFLEAFEAKDTKKLIIYTSLAGLFVGLFSFAWGGWWYIMDFIIAASVIYLGYTILVNRDKLRQPASLLKIKSVTSTLLLIGLFILVSGIFVTLFTNFNSFWDGFYAGPTSFLTLKEVGISTVWPNVFTTVAEQNPASLNNVINQIGIRSRLLVFFALLGIVLTMIKKDTKDLRDLWFVAGSAVWFVIILAIKPQNLNLFLFLIGIPILIRLFLMIKHREKDIDVKAAVLLALWFASTIFASVKGVRYILLGVPAFGMALGVALAFLFYYGSKYVARWIKLNTTITKITFIIVVLLFLVNPTRLAFGIAQNEVPSMNDAWYDSLKKIDNEASQDAIINSWWDFGHWFKMIGNRPVTFDGTSQNTPNAHWIGSVLLADEELYAIGTLNMLDCGQNKAHDEINEKFKDIPHSIDLIRELVRINKQEANNLLEREGFTEQERTTILRYSHCEPPENYFITSEDMVGKSGVWGHFGAWNFDRALMYNTLKKKEYQNNLEGSTTFLTKRFNLSQKRAENMYFEIQGIADSGQANSWIAPWPSYQGTGSCKTNDDDTITCDIQQGASLTIDINSLDTIGLGTQDGARFPNAIATPRDDGTYEIREFKDSLGFSIVIFQNENGGWQRVLTHPRLIESMFTKLFFLNGHGLNYFEKFSEARSLNGGNIIIWKVDWEGNTTNSLPYFIKQRQAAEQAIQNALEAEAALAEAAADNTTQQNLSVTNESA